MSVVSLTVHKNTLEKRRQQNMRREFKRVSKALAKPGMAGFAIVVWDGDCSSWTEYATTSRDAVAPEAIPAFVESRLMRAQLRTELAADLSIGPPEPEGA